MDDKKKWSQLRRIFLSEIHRCIGQIVEEDCYKCLAGVEIHEIHVRHWCHCFQMFPAPPDLGRLSFFPEFRLVAPSKAWIQEELRAVTKVEKQKQQRRDTMNSRQAVLWECRRLGNLHNWSYSYLGGLMWVEKCYVNMSLQRPQMLAAQILLGRNATFAMQNNFWKMWTIGFKAVLVNDKYQIPVGFG